MVKKHRLNKKQRKELIRFGEYMIGGGVWFWSGYIIIVVAVANGMPLFWANFLGNGVGLTLNFLIERYWVFKTKRQTKLGEATSRYVIYTGLNAFLLNYLILQGLRNVGIEPAIGQFIASAFFTVWNYVWYKLWVFKGREPIRRTKHHA
jgi:putative flippase GtrA